VGSIKISQPFSKLRILFGDWVDDFTREQIKFIGALEIIGAAGIVLPMVFNLASRITSIAALGLAAIAVGAALVNFSRVKYGDLLVNIIFCALAIFVAFGRNGFF
tara:strand:+ start:256 stop:570 length:315 start_codon:yes stop_codon:yes gene_type:complete